MKKLLLFLLPACLLVSLCGCARHGEAPGPAATAEAEPEIGPDGLVIDTASLDLDGDGVKEDCAMTYGPTSGLFSIVITASANGTEIYKNTFVLPWCAVSFAEQDGAPMLRMEINEYQSAEPKVEYHRLYAENGRIVIEGLAPDGGYWGGKDWNTGIN